MATIKSVSILIVDGDWVESKDQSPEGIRLVQTGNIGVGEYLDKFNRAKYISEETLQRLNCTEVLVGDILISRLPDPIGRACIVPGRIGRAITAVDCTIIRLDPRKCNAEYFVYYTQSKMYQNRLSQFFAGSTRMRISRKNLEQIEIPLPSIAEQKCIASKFGIVEKLITMRKEQLAKLDQLVKSRFIELFGDSTNRRSTVLLEEISDFVTVGIANSATHAYADSGIVMLRNQNIKENYLDENDLIYITPDFAKKYGSKQLAENDILVIRTGYPGVACLVPKKYEGCQTFTTLIVRLKDSTSAHANYVCHYINSSFGKDYVEQSKVGVAQQNFGAKALAKMPIVVPPMELQEEFATFVEQTDKSKLAIQASLDKLELLKKSLMQEYFG